MNQIASGVLNLNKFEKLVLTVFAVGVMLFATVNIVWLANQFGISIGNSTINKILDAMANGSSLGTAFAAIVGVTLPAWALAAAAALGATAA